MLNPELNEARKNFIKMVYVPYRIKVIKSPSEEKHEDFYALIPAGLYSIVGKETFVEILNKGFAFLYTPLAETAHFHNLLIGPTNEYGIPYLECDSSEVEGMSFRLIPIPWGEFPKELFSIDTIPCAMSIVEPATQLVHAYVDRFIKDRCVGKSPFDFCQYNNPKDYFEFLADVLEWAKKLPSAT